MKSALKVVMIVLLCYCSFVVKAQDAPTPQDAVDFIRKAGDERGYVDKYDTQFKSIDLDNGILYIYSENNVGGHLSSDLYIIDLSRAYMKETSIYGNSKQDIALSIMRHKIPGKFYKLSSVAERKDYFIKKSDELISSLNGNSIVYFVQRCFYPPESGSYKELDYYGRVVKAFDFLIKYYGGGKVLNDSNSKF